MPACSSLCTNALESKCAPRRNNRGAGFPRGILTRGTADHSRMSSFAIHVVCGAQSRAI